MPPPDLPGCALARVDISVIKVLFFFGFNGTNRLGLHQKGCEKIQPDNGPQAAENQYCNEDNPDPDNTEIKIVAKTPTHPQNYTFAGTI